MYTKAMTNAMLTVLETDVRDTFVTFFVQNVATKSIFILDVEKRWLYTRRNQTVEDRVQELKPAIIELFFGVARSLDFDEGRKAA